MSVRTENSEDSQKSDGMGLIEFFFVERIDQGTARNTLNLDNNFWSILFLLELVPGNLRALFLFFIFRMYLILFCFNIESKACSDSGLVDTATGRSRSGLAFILGRSRVLGTGFWPTLFATIFCWSCKMVSSAPEVLGKDLLPIMDNLGSSVTIVFCDGVCGCKPESESICWASIVSLSSMNWLGGDSVGGSIAPS